MQLIRAAIFPLALVLGTFALLSATKAQQPQQQGPTIEQRVGMEIGPILVRAAALSAQVEQLQALVAQRDKTIADLQTQLNGLRTGGAGEPGSPTK